MMSNSPTKAIVSHDVILDKTFFDKYQINMKSNSDVCRTEDNMEQDERLAKAMAKRCYFHR